MSSRNAKKKANNDIATNKGSLREETFPTQLQYGSTEPYYQQGEYYYHQPHHQQQPYQPQRSNVNASSTSQKFVSSISKELEQLSPSRKNRRNKRKKKKKHASANAKFMKPNGPFESFSNIPAIRTTPPGVARSALVKRKLHALCRLFNFSVDNKNKNKSQKNLQEIIEERDSKKETLMEIYEYASTNKQFFHGPNTAAMIRMVAANLFREDRISYHFSDDAFDLNTATTSWHYASQHDGLNDTNEAINVRTLSSITNNNNNINNNSSNNIKPCKWWSHQQIIYEIFLAFIVSENVDSNVIKRYVHRSFLRQFVDLTRSGDPGERSYVKAILHRIYEKAVTYRKFLRRCMDYVFLAYVDDGGLYPPYPGLDDLLEIYYSIIDGFNVPLKEEHHVFFVKVLLPLHKMRFYANIKDSVIQCTRAYLEKDASVSILWLQALLKWWPRRNTRKAICFFDELKMLLHLISPSNFVKMIPDLFKLLGECMLDSNFQIAEQTLLCWRSEYFVSLVAQNRKEILPKIFPALQKNAKSHWHQLIKSLSINVLKLFNEIDPWLVTRCNEVLKEEKSRKKKLEKMKRKRNKKLNLRSRREKT